MVDDSATTRIERLVRDCLTYVDLKFASVKLHMVESLSALCGNLIALLIFGVFALLALLTLSVALLLWVATWAGSLLCAALIVGVFYLLVAVVVFALRRRLFANTMARMFSRMFFPLKEHCDD